jgi:phospholipase/carboxylesterase
MESNESALFHRVIQPRTPHPSSNPALILLHGRGADEEDLLGLASYLDDRFLILSVRAPYPFQFGGGYTWYDVGQVGTPEPTMFKISYNKLASFINDSLTQHPIDKTRVFLLGFSMGTVMSYALALTNPAMFRGVAANSGYVPENTHLTFLWSQVASTEFFITHGTHDPVIPVQLGRRAKQLLEEGRARFEYKEYPMAHEISQESLDDVSSWLTERLNQPQ